MTQGEKLLAYYKTLDEKEKLNLIISVNRKALINDLSNDLADAYFGMARDFFNPRKADGSIDVQELETRMGMVYDSEMRLRYQVGKAIKEAYDALPGDISEADRKALATHLVYHRSSVMAELNNQHNMLHNVMGVTEGMLEESKMALLKHHGYEPSDNDEVNFHNLMTVMEDIRKVSKNSVSYEVADGDEMAWEMGTEYDPTGLPKIRDERLEARYLNPQQIRNMTTAQEQGHLPRVAEAELLIDKGIQTAGVAELTDLAKQAYQILEKTGSGQSSLLNWHFTNSGKYEDVMRTLRSYQRSLEDGQPTSVARDQLIQHCLVYLDGKETVRDSQHGKIRFETIMTLLSEVMPADDFKRLTDRVNRKRGAKPGDVTYVSPEKYRSAAARADCRVHMTDGMEKQFRNVESVYGIIPAENERWIDHGIVTREQYRKLNPIKDPLHAVGEDGLLRNRDFVAVAFSASLAAGEKKMAGGWLNEETPVPGAGASLEQVEAARNLAKNAFEEYQKGNKAPLAGLISAGLRTIAENRRTDGAVDTKWVMEGEISARLQNMMEADPDLKRLAKEAGLTQEHMKQAAGARTIANIYARAAEASNEIHECWDSMSLARATELYADMLKGAFVQHMIADHDGKFMENEKTQELIAHLYDHGGEDEFQKAQEKAREQWKKPCSLIGSMSKAAQRASLDKLADQVIKDLDLMDKSPMEMRAFLADREMWKTQMKPAFKAAENAMSPNRHEPEKVVAKAPRTMAP